MGVPTAPATVDTAVDTDTQTSKAAQALQHQPNHHNDPDHQSCER